MKWNENSGRVSHFLKIFLVIFPALLIGDSIAPIFNDLLSFDQFKAWMILVEQVVHPIPVIIYSIVAAVTGSLILLHTDKRLDRFSMVASGIACGLAATDILFAIYNYASHSSPDSSSLLFFNLLQNLVFDVLGAALLGGIIVIFPHLSARLENTNFDKRGYKHSLREIIYMNALIVSGILIAIGTLVYPIAARINFTIGGPKNIETIVDRAMPPDKMNGIQVNCPGNVFAANFLPENNLIQIDTPRSKITLRQASSNALPQITDSDTLMADDALLPKNEAMVWKRAEMMGSGKAKTFFADHIELPVTDAFLKNEFPITEIAFFRSMQNKLNGAEGQSLIWFSPSPGDLSLQDADVYLDQVGRKTFLIEHEINSSPPSRVEWVGVYSFIDFIPASGHSDTEIPVSYRALQDKKDSPLPQVTGQDTLLLKSDQHLVFLLKQDCCETGLQPFSFPASKMQCYRGSVIGGGISVTGLMTTLRGEGSIRMNSQVIHASLGDMVVLRGKGILTFAGENSAYISDGAYVYLNNKLVNMTLWMIMPLELKFAIFGGVVALFGFRTRLSNAIGRLWPLKRDD